jgi:hypothetical protein
VRLRYGDRCRSHDALIRVYDEAGNVIETHEHAGESVSGAHLRFRLRRVAKPLNSCSQLVSISQNLRAAIREFN